MRRRGAGPRLDQQAADERQRGRAVLGAQVQRGQARLDAPFRRKLTSGAQRRGAGPRLAQQAADQRQRGRVVLGAQVQRGQARFMRHSVGH